MLKFTNEKNSKPLLRMFYVTENNLYLKWNSNWWAFKNKDQKQSVYNCVCFDYPRPHLT